MTEQEKQDLDTLKVETNRIRLTTFDYLRSIDRMTSEQLAQSGYKNKTNAEAMQIAYRNALKQIDKLTSDFIRKYPDEK